MKQGCPVSGLLFILVIELFSIKIRVNPAIEGIIIRNETFKQSSYADDLENFLRNIDSIKLTLRELELFGRVSGLHCNIGKCEAMALGDSPIEHIQYAGEEIKWVDEMTITGITFTKNDNDNRELNFEKAIEKLRTQLNIWKQRDLSLVGKIQIIKTFGISQIQYIMNMVTPTTEMLKTIKKLLNNFLWGSNVNKIKHTTMIAEYDKGGLKMPDVESILYAQRLMWARRYFSTEHRPWKVFFEWQFEKIGGLSVFQNTSIAIKEITKMPLMSFYESIIIAWAKCYDIPMDLENFKKQVLYFNKNIVAPSGRTLFYPDLYEKQLISINDVILDRRLITPAEMKIAKNLTGIEFLHYTSVYTCLKRIPNLAHLLQNAPLNCIIHSTKSQMFGENSKSLYRKLCEKITEIPSSENKLSEMLAFDPDKFKNIYRLPFLVTIETKLRAFQFKISHLIFYTNEMLFERKMVDSPLCTFCQAHTETLIHLFVSCSYVKPLWLSMENMLDYSFSEAEKLLGCFSTMKNKKFDVLLKYYVHICRINNQKPSPKVLKRRILYSQFIESEIAKKRNKMDNHDLKWSSFLQNFSSQ